MPDRIAIVSYESPFAPAGGIAAVMKHLPEGLARASNSEVIAITPFHQKNEKTLSVESKMSSFGTIQVEYEGLPLDVSVLRLDQNGSWFFLKPADPRFFAGVRHPYDVANAAILLRDALFFGKAVAKTKTAIDPLSKWTLLLQDWEAATTTLALPDPGSQSKVRTFLTLHNSYDSPASDDDLLRFGINPLIAPGNTILERALQLVEEPVFTVSDQFAKDFVEDDLQAVVMAPHLQSELENRLAGIDNGPFTKLAIRDDVISTAHKGDFSSLMSWKNEQRSKARAAIESVQPRPETPVWGDITQFQFDGSPWFVLAGRDDPRQKGNDVACLAIEKFLDRGGKASFFFFPIPGDEGLPGLSFLKDLAFEYPHRVLALPFVFQEGYFEVLRGATYGLMPSLYEPFGMANEFYLNGCVGIGRATGGIIQQIIPYRAAASFSEAVKRRSDRLFGAASHPTGFLYREQDGLPSALDDWQSINQASYLLDGTPNRIEQRKSLPLFQAMVKELTLCIADAVDLFNNSPDRYYQLLSDGISYVQTSFSWEKTAQAYLRYIE